MRPPLPEEQRSPDWRSFEDHRLHIWRLVAEAFAETQRGGGVTLHQMDVLDRRGSPAELIEAGKRDREGRWQDLSAEKLETFSDDLAFLDAWGLRFHLPAFMHLALAKWRDGRADGDHSGILWALNKGPADPCRRQTFDLLDHAQKQAVAAFLWFIASSADDAAANASEGLANGWDAYLPASFQLASE